MTILVTGGAGYIGSHTCVALLEAGHDVVILDNLCNSRGEVIGRIEALGKKSVRFYQEDMRDTAALAKIFAAQKMDAVIHFAGLKAVPESCQKPLDYYGANIGGTVALLEAMRAANCKTIVFSSSATVYGGENPVPFREDMPIGTATNPYGTTKIFIEQILRDLYAAEPDWHISLLRYFNPVGAHTSGQIGDNPTGTPYNFMPILSDAALGKRPELIVTGSDYDTPDGTCIRDYIHVLDLADGHIKALDRAVAAEGCEAFNLGTGKGLSVLDLITAFEEASGIKVPWRFGPRRPGDIAVCYADTAKAEEVLGFKCKRGAKEMCEDQWRFLQGQRSK